MLMKADERPGDSEHDDRLRSLVVLERLEVGPVSITPQRVSARYEVTRRGRKESFELAYKYEEPVFTPEAPSDVNLASMIVAQVALNYGLFCEEIVLHGPYDRADRKLLEDAASNTAREIFVKKFLEPNPFLVGDAAALPAVRKSNYLTARLIFPEAVERSSELDPWQTSSDRYAVLSSGGKDSLVTHCVLDDLGHETHPIFVNESGRHWFTALNAHRYFSAHVPNTGRVWTSSDRLFSWMLRQLPFVRRDFASLRSDEYPIRLWTVAVFLFGVLPLLRKRGIGKLCVGDEYDTTSRAKREGISHFDGLFDQSRYFDDMLSRYFRAKQWHVVQFSILRPLSELLVEKILAERYPALMKHRMSCHATHMEGEVVRPCGRCEKCRRIVGMMTALAQDPASIGFEEPQIRECLAELAERGTHQERPAVEHLGHLLRLPRLGTRPSRPRPEVMKLRFDGERSPVEAIPRELRRPLFGLFLEHAAGAVRKTGRNWIDFDVLSSDEITRPFPFERKPNDTKPASFLLGELTWPEAEEKLRDVDVALLPVGSIEQHGPHLPLDTDAFDADYLAKGVAAACSEPRPIVLPLVPYGVSYAHDDFTGTVSIGPETLSRLVYEIGTSIARQGITKLIIINGHGGNGPALHFAAQLINRDAHIFTCVDTGETSDTDINAMTDVSNDVHAGDIETSTTLAVRPELVKLDRAERYVPEFSNKYLDFTSKRAVGWYARTARITPSGVFGDPTKATREKGEKMWEVMIHHLVELVNSIRGLPLDEIYQKRY